MMILPVKRETGLRGKQPKASRETIMSRLETKGRLMVLKILTEKIFWAENQTRIELKPTIKPAQEVPR